MKIWVNVTEQQMKELLELPALKAKLKKSEYRVKKLAEEILATVGQDGDEVVVLDEKRADEMLMTAWNWKDGGKE